MLDLSTWTQSETWSVKPKALLWTSFLVCLSGIEPQGNVVLKPAEFLVETVEAGLGEVLVYVEDPEGHTEEVEHTLSLYFITHHKVNHSWQLLCVCIHQARVIPNNDKNRTYSVVYLPKVEGLHKVRTAHNGWDVLMKALEMKWQRFHLLAFRSFGWPF